MPDKESKELRVREKQEVASPAEPTQPGIFFTPDVDIFETDSEITLLADLPGVEAGDLTIDLRDNVLTLAGNVEAGDAADEEPVYTEYQTGKYYRQFTLSEVVDQQKISAALNDGVLRLRLPKVAKATPRKIEVKAG